VRGSLWANPGLAIFSKYEVSNIVSEPFSHQLFYDYWLVNRGVLSATISPPGFPAVRVHSVHFGPPLGVLTFFAFLPRAIVRYVDKFNQQVDELVARVGSDTGDLPAILAGDFNCTPDSPDYAYLKSKLLTVGVENAGPDFERADAKPTGNPPGEFMLTGGLRTPKVLDYLFASKDLAKLGQVYVGEQGVKEGRGFEMISDHNPVEAVFRTVKEKEFSSDDERVYGLE